MDPYVSVIVTAYNRRRYLPDALRSLERQTLDKGKFEVIVVKNFEDPASDEIIRRNGWRWVYSDESSQGRFALAGLEEARGEVITFLDDDDMYSNDRLYLLSEAFRARHDLMYFHNSQRVIGPLSTGSKEPAGASQGANFIELTYINPPLDQAKCLYFLKSKMFVNSSSMAFRKAVLDDRQAKALLPLCEREVDFCLASTAIRHVSYRGGLLARTPAPLTYYRVTSLSATPHRWNLRSADPMKAVKELLAAYAIWSYTEELISVWLEGTPCRQYIEALSLVKLLEVSSAPLTILRDLQASGQLHLHNIKGSSVLSRLIDLSRAGYVDEKALLTSLADLMVSSLPQPLRKYYWLLRYSLQAR